MGRATAHFGRRTLGTWGGIKRSNIIKFQLHVQSQFQRFLKTLCVFLRLKDIKHIRRDFYSVALVMPQHSPRIGLRGAWGSKMYFAEHVHVAYHIEGDDE